MVQDKLNIKNELTALDRKDREYYNSMTDEEQKKFSPYLMLRYAASVDGHADLQAWYLLATNQRANQHFFEINSTKHKQLLWLMCTTVSPDMGVHRHYWLGAKKSSSGNNRICKFLTELFPNLKPDEIELLAKINSEDDIKQLAKNNGWDDKRISSEL